MEPTALQQDGLRAREVEYDEGPTVFVADLGVGADATVDVVGDTAIVVAGGEQFDLDLPAGEAQAFIRNGVLTVEVTTNPEEDLS